MNRVGQPAAGGGDGHVGRAAAAPPHDACGRVRRPLGGRLEVHDHVLDHVTDDAQHRPCVHDVGQRRRALHPLQLRSWPSESSAVVARAARLLESAERQTTWRERRRSRRLGSLLADREGRELLFRLTDEVLRTPTATRSMQQLRALVDAGLPRSLPPADRAALRLAAVGARVAPQPVAAIVRRRIRGETRGVIIPAADPAFARHVAARRDAGFAVNVNLLGEAILGDAEADRRLDALCARMRRPDVGYVSVKVSALCANLDVLAFEHEVERIADRLRDRLHGRVWSAIHRSSSTSTWRSTATST